VPQAVSQVFIRTQDIRSVSLVVVHDVFVQVVVGSHVPRVVRHGVEAHPLHTSVQHLQLALADVRQGARVPGAVRLIALPFQLLLKLRTLFGCDLLPKFLLVGREAGVAVAELAAAQAVGTLVLPEVLLRTLVVLCALVRAANPAVLLVLVGGARG